MRLTRRGFLKGAAAGGAMFALPRLARAQGSSSSYSVAVLGDTHFDQALQPEFVASYGDLTEDVSAADMVRYTAQSTYHANWVENNQTHFKEFLRNGDMWRARCPSLVAASAALAASKPTRFLLQVGDLVQGDCNDANVHAQMLNDAVSAIRGGFPSNLPFLTVLGNHDFRGTGARNAYLNFVQPFMASEIANLTGVTPAATAYPVYSFRLGDDLWVFCDFETVDMNPICDVIDADPSARHVFVVTHGPFTTCAACTSIYNARWRLAGRAGSESSRPRLYETLSRRHAIVFSGHTHKTDYYWHRNEYGGFAEMTVNSVWMRDDLATSVPLHDKVDDYASPLSNSDYKNEIAYFRPGLRRYFHNEAAGHYRLNVSDDVVTMEFYPGAATTPARIFTMWTKESANGRGWIDERALVTGTTGAWSQNVDYDWDTGKASIAGDRKFTPNRQSKGKSATVTVKMQFTDMATTVDAPEGVQAAVQLGAGGSFQVWTRGSVANVEMLPIANSNSQLETGNIPMWLNVAAEGVSPRAGVEYTFRFKIDYATRRYAVSVKNAYGSFVPLGANGETSFALASNATRLSSVQFKGGGVLTSLKGYYARGVKIVVE